LPMRHIFNGTDFVIRAFELTACWATVNAGHTSTTVLDYWWSVFGTAVCQEVCHILSSSCNATATNC